MKIIFIADFFAEDVLGGGELNNEELISMLIQDGHEVLKVHSHKVTAHFIESNASSRFIIANFVNINKSLIPLFYDKKYANIQ